jgi:hypothetical protein
MSAVKMITVSEFVALMYGSKAKFCGLQTVTEPKLNKKSRETGDPWFVVFPGVDAGNVRKVAHGVALSGPDYKAIIDLRHEKIEAAGGTPGTYVAGETWHEAVEGTKCLRRHKKTGELYAYFAFVSKVKKGDRWIPLKAKTRIVDVTTGAELDKGKLAAFLPVEHAPQNQGLGEDDAVIVRTYKLSSVRALTVDGKVYVVAAK